MHLRSTSIIKITVKKNKKWLYLLNALIVFDGTFKTKKCNLLTYPLVRKVLSNYLSQTLSGTNVSEDTNVTPLPKKELFFERVQKYFCFLFIASRALKQCRNQ